MAELLRYISEGVTLLADPHAAGGVTFAFTERTGGVSEGDCASLNLGDACGDDPASVAENRRRALAAIGAASCAGALVAPRQVHGDRVVSVRESAGPALEASRAAARAGADAVVCTARDVPVLLCFADCVPVVVCAPGGFAVAHSGWRGTVAGIAGKAAGALMRETGAAADELDVYIGPHVGASDYEVSPELAERFRGLFGDGSVAGERNLDLAFCVRASLESAGVPAGRIACCDDSTASHTDRFFSYRAENGHTGRHAAVAVMSSGDAPAWEPRPLS